ncbi:MAG: histidine--tRNA ligase [Planctomycetota bacterium]
MTRPDPRLFKGFRDVFADDLVVKQWMIERVRGVYERYGYIPLETPALEFVDCLGKNLPEQDTPEGGIFAFRNPDLAQDESGPDSWLALRYDLTAPLARLCAQYANLSRPFRRYQIGPVWRYEKPGIGRFREFTQFDFDAVGVSGPAADAEVACIMCDALQALDFEPGDFVIRVNNRKVLLGVLASAGIDDGDLGDPRSKPGTVLRAIDKLDRLGLPGVVELLGPGREDETGDFTEGAHLDDAQIERVRAFLSIADRDRASVCAQLASLVGDSPVGRAGIDELTGINGVLDALGYESDRIIFDPTVVRGLGYYTGPVFEGVLTKEIRDAKGRVRTFGSVYGGGRYDGLIERFTGERVPATGASVGLDRLLEAIKLIRGTSRTATADVLIVNFDDSMLTRYMTLAQSFRDADIATEVYLGKGNMKKQLKYADRLGVPFAVIIGSEEFERGTAQVKNLWLGAKLSAEMDSREKWAKQPAQEEVPIDGLVAYVRDALARQTR